MNVCGCPFISSQNQDAFSLLICGSSFWERDVDQGGASVFILLAQFQFHLMSNHTWNIYRRKSVATKRKSTQTKQKPFGRKCFKWPQIRFQPNFASNMQKIFSATMRKFPLIKSNGTVPHSGVLASLMWLDLGLPRQGYPGLLGGAGRETADAAFLLLVWVVQVLKTSFSPVRFWRMESCRWDAADPSQVLRPRLGLGLIFPVSHRSHLWASSLLSKLQSPRIHFCSSRAHSLTSGPSSKGQGPVQLLGKYLLRKFNT